MISPSLGLIDSQASTSGARSDRGPESAARMPAVEMVLLTGVVPDVGGDASDRVCDPQGSEYTQKGQLWERVRGQDARTNNQKPIGNQYWRSGRTRWCDLSHPPQLMVSRPGRSVSPSSDTGVIALRCAGAPRGRRGLWLVDPVSAGYATIHRSRVRPTADRVKRPSGRERRALGD